MKPKKSSTTNIYSGKIINVQVDEVILEDGKLAKREVVRHSPAVCVLAYDSEGIVYLVEQYRHAVGEYIIEAVAGCCDVGETPEESARRELNEEINALCETLTPLGCYLPSPGYVDEIIYLYSAEIKGFKQGKLDEDEFINIIKMPINSLYDKIMDGTISDGKTIAVALKHRFMQTMEKQE